jgi:hypothetical protein
VCSNTAKADILTPNTDIFWTPFTLGVFLANLILNFIIFGIGYIVFVERNVHKIDKKPFLIAVLLITLFGFLADSIVLLFQDSYYAEPLVISFLAASFLIFIFDYLVCRYFLRLDKKKCTILAAWMALFTNPFLYVIITYFFSVLFFSPYTPAFPGTPQIGLIVDESNNSVVISSIDDVDYINIYFISDTPDETISYYVQDNMSISTDREDRKEGSISAGDRITGFKSGSSYLLVFEISAEIIDEISFVPLCLTLEDVEAYNGSRVKLIGNYTYSDAGKCWVASVPPAVIRYQPSMDEVEQFRNKTVVVVGTIYSSYPQDGEFIVQCIGGPHLLDIELIAEYEK